MAVLYICDRKACGENHDCRECSHTSNIEHAVNFEREGLHHIEKSCPTNSSKTVNELRKEHGLSGIDGGDVVLTKE